MRTLVIALLMLFVFSTTQVAMAFESCADPLCSVSMTDKNDTKKEKKSDKPAHHCCGTHVMNKESSEGIGFPPQASNAMLDAPQHFASISPSALLEPPASL